MEGEEAGDYEAEGAGEDVRGDHVVGHLVVNGLGLEDGGHEGPGRPDDHVAAEGSVEQHAHEELVIIETNAVGDPGAVMVHLQHAFVALGTVVASVRLLIHNNNYVNK